MSEASVLVRRPAPAPQGPIACTLSPNDYAGRLDDFRQGVFAHLVGMERPRPERLRLLLGGDADPRAVAELLAREQECCAFLAFTLTATGGRLAADLEVPAEAAPTLDGFAALAELAAPAGGGTDREAR